MQIPTVMNKTIFLFLFVASIALAACGGSDDSKNSGAAPNGSTPQSTEQSKMLAEGKGIGEIKAVEVKTPLEGERITRGEAIYKMKCSACHRLDEKRLVGPGWKDVTHRRKPEWIMNMVTNVDVMLERDDEANKLLQLCLTRMPNQNVSVGDARDVLEYMRKNDGEK